MGSHRISRSFRHGHRREYSSRKKTSDSKTLKTSSRTQVSVVRAFVKRFLLSIFNFLLRRWGYILFGLFVIIYISSFWDVVLSRPAMNEPTIAEVVRVPIPTNPHLPNQEKITVQVKLPGAIASEGKKFESLDGLPESTRDSNVLPGAIGLGGSFDEHGESQESPREQNVTQSTESSEKATSTIANTQSQTKPELSPENKQSKMENTILEASNPEASNSASETKKAKKKKKKKNKKKKKKKKKKKVNDSSSVDVSSNDPKPPKSSSDPKPDEKPSSIDSAATMPGDSGEASSQSPADDKQQSKTKKKKNKKKKKKKKKKSMTNQVPFTTNSTYSGQHPMNRKMEELQVSGDTGALDEKQVREYYEKLVKAYLAPFNNGIDRRSFFEILRRKTYSLSPPGSSKGIQTILFQLIQKKLYLMDPYEVTKNSKPFYKTRIQELIWLLSDIAKEERVPDTEFLVAIHDCVQTVNAEHTYRGSVYQESSPTFTIVSCNFSDNIPFPMWEGDPVRGGLKSWDAKMEKYKGSDNTPWAEKKPKAVFRGGNRPSMYYKTKEEADEHSKESGRSRLHFLSSQNEELFDVGVSGRWGGEMHRLQPLSEADHHQFKYILYAEGNCFWADRLNKQVFGPSAIIKQETPCGQFWEPLLKPFTHYIPTDFFFGDTVEKINWAKDHDSEVQAIVKNANDFASNFLTQKGIKTYVEVLLTEYSKLLNNKEIKQEKGSEDVTAR